MKENSLWDAGKGSRISLDIEWSQKDHAAFFLQVHGHQVQMTGDKTEG